MLLFESLVPPALFAISSLAFFIAIHLPYRARLYLAPFVFGSAILSLHTSPYLTWLTGMNVLWALFSCIWIMHAAAVLYLDRLSIPRSAPWTATYKVWNDPQRRINWAAFSPQRQIPLSSRVGFVLRRLFKMVLSWLLQLCIIGPSVPIYFQFTAQDFAPSRQVFVRRLLAPNPAAPITLREMQIRLFVSVYWIWIAYLMLNVCNVVLSIFFVAVLRIDAPDEWHPLFGSPLQAYSIRRFWTKFWHRLTVASCGSSGRFVTRRVAGMVPGSRGEKIFIAFWTFLLSGLCHAVADWQAGELGGRPMDDMVFFMGNFAAGAVEALVVTRWKKKSHGGGFFRQFPKPLEKLLGFVWVLGFFFWITPKWQYAKLHALLVQVQES